MKKSRVEILIVGGGPSGLALAARLTKDLGIKVRILERESTAGGIPRHSFHSGYGIRDLHRLMSGPNYARYYVNCVENLKIELSVNSTAWNWNSDLGLVVTSPQGLEEISAQKIILATGARERSRNSRLVAGTRPEGIYTTGSLQQLVYLNKLHIGDKAVIIGSEHVSYSALITLKHAGVKTVAMIEEGEFTNSYKAVELVTRAFYRYSFYTNSKLIKINGQNRVNSILIKQREKLIEIKCDTLIFTGNWVPDNELARRGNIECDSITKSPKVDNKYETSRKGIYAVGNLLLPIKSADQCVIETRKLFVE